MQRQAIETLSDSSDVPDLEALPTYDYCDTTDHQDPFHRESSKISTKQGEVKSIFFLKIIQTFFLKFHLGKF